MIKNLIIDLDGVVWIEGKPTPGASLFIAFLQKRKVRFLFLTNNSTKTQRQYASRLGEMGIRVKEKDILTSSGATCLFLKKLKPDARIHAVGEHGLLSDLERHGFVLADERVDFVVVGLDRKFDYEKLSHACNLIKEGARFIATNPDLTFPSEDGVTPGAGSIAAAIGACSSRKPLVVGKPNPTVIRIALETMGAKKEETAIVGDRFDTDILAAKRMGLKSILILTGIETDSTMEKSKLKPDHTFRNLLELKKRWPF